MMVTEIWGFIGDAITAGSFDAREDRHLSWTPMVVDEEGWAGAARDPRPRPGGSASTCRRRSAARIAKSGGQGTRVAAAMTCFELPPPAAGEYPRHGVNACPRPLLVHLM